MDRNIRTGEVVGIRHFSKLKEEAQHHTKENHTHIHQDNFTDFPTLQHEFLILTKFIIEENIQNQISGNNGFTIILCEVVDRERTACNHEEQEPQKDVGRPLHILHEITSSHYWPRVSYVFWK